MGRPPKGLEHVDGLSGDRSSKQRLRVVLQTVNGERTVDSACRELGIGEARFHALRREALEGALQALEPSPRGRPGKPPESAEAKRIRELEARVRDLTIDLRIAETQTELALVMPHVLSGVDVSKKKRKPSAKRQRKRAKGGRRRGGAGGGTSSGSGG